MKVKINAEVMVGVGAAARILAVSRLTVLNYLKAGRFPGAFHLPTGMWRIPLGDIEALRQAGSSKKGGNHEQ